VPVAPARSSSNVHLNEEADVTIEPAASRVSGDTGDPAYFAAKAAEQASAENFPVAMRVLPKTVREDLAAFYVFARYVDDLGDELTGDRVAALREVDADLGRLASGGTPKLQPVRGLARITADGRVPIEPFHDLVAANLMDQVKTDYATFAELVSYCRLSANPVGRVVLHLAGQATPENVADSDAVCTGLQIVEHLQDVAEDRGNGRIYLPREDLTAFGVFPEEFDWPHADEDLKALLRWEAGRAAVMLAKGVPLTRRLRGWARPAVIGYVAGGRAALTALRKIDYDVLAGAPSTTKSGVIRSALGVLAGRKR
jgi:squalene synthase HpnC